MSCNVLANQLVEAIRIDFWRTIPRWVILGTELFAEGTSRNGAPSWFFICAQSHHKYCKHLRCWFSTRLDQWFNLIFSNVVDVALPYMIFKVDLAVENLIFMPPGLAVPAFGMFTSHVIDPILFSLILLERGFTVFE